MATTVAPSSRYDFYVNKYLHGDSGEGDTHSTRTGTEEELRTSPLFSLGVQESVQEQQSGEAAADTPLQSQYGLLGFHLPTADEPDQRTEPILLNVAAPNSTFICGSQGSGKSFTLSTMLESCLVADDFGKLDHPVSGLVFHYDGDSSGSIAEAAYLCSRGIKVHVLVSESYRGVLAPQYQKLPGAAQHLTVDTFKLRSKDVSVKRMKQLMAFSGSESMPLYMVVLERILREMAIHGGGAQFNYREFKQRVDAESFSSGQNGPLNLRIDLLESFLDYNKDKTAKGKSKAMPAGRDLFNMKPGELTIVDLTDLFVDASTACVLFDICLSLAVADTHKTQTGLIVALDEAHKYMNKSQAADDFTGSLLTAIRMQRHTGTRVVVATQEPTISPALLDLCSVSIVHHFKSPEWFDAIKKHLGAASRLVLSEAAQHELFRQIMTLQVGESLLFAPSSFVRMVDGRPRKLGSEVVRMKTRLRPKGKDGGVSVLAGSRAGAAAGGAEELIAIEMVVRRPFLRFITPLEEAGERWYRHSANQPGLVGRSEDLRLAIDCHPIKTSAA